MNDGKVTMQQVAAEAGVSAMTVSHVLRGTGRVGEDTRKRVKQAAAELGHRPNRSAQSMRGGRYGNVALVLSTDRTRSELHSDLLRGIHRSLSRHKLHLSMTELDDDRLSNDDYMAHILQSLAADGLLLNYKWHTPPALIELIDRFHLPVVWVADRYAYDSVYPDLYNGIREATQRVIDLGHRRIAHLGIQEAPANCDPLEHIHHSVSDCLRGYTDTMQHAGLDAWSIELQKHPAALSDALAAPNRPTALICRGVHAANRAMLSAAQAGLRVPEDISIVPLCHETGHHLGLRCAQIVMPTLSLGEAAVDMLADKIAQPEAALPSRAIPMEWKDGPTLGTGRTERRKNGKMTEKR
ncbi:MAG: LacI family DNA-binding transcriptional regulator [Verrucomicrobiota bacterium]